MEISNWIGEITMFSAVLIFVFCFSLARAAAKGDRLPGPEKADRERCMWQEFIEKRFERVE